MRRFVWGRRVTAVVVVLSVLVGGCVALVIAPRAAADQAPAPAPSPTIVSLVDGKCTATTNVYQLSDGSYQAQIFSQPIRFKDAQGNWQSFDTSLQLASLAGQWQTTSTPVQTTLGTTAQLAWGGYTVILGLGGQTQTLGVLPLAGANQVTVSGMATATSLSYTPLALGAEQNLILASAAAPSSFTLTLSHPGLTLKQAATGGWGLYRPGDRYPLYLLWPASAHDSSANEDGVPAYCDGLTMTVNPGLNTSTVTVSLPKSWLSASGRVFPVIIDPALTLNPNPGDVAYCDTWIQSGNPNASQGPSGQETSGYTTGTLYNRSLLAFNLTSPTNLTGAYIHSANFKLYKNNQHGNVATVSLRSMNKPWDYSATWSKLGAAVNSFPSSFCSGVIGSDNPATGQYLNVACRQTVQDWVSGAQANNGFLVNQLENKNQEGATYYTQWDSADTSGGHPPQLVLNYDNAVAASPSGYQSSYTEGSTASVTVTASTSYASDIQDIRLGIDRAAADGKPKHGVLAWWSTKPSDATWVCKAAGSNGGYFAYYNDQSYGIQYITPKLSSCTISADHKTAKFVFSINTNWDGTQANYLDTYLGMGPSSSESWSTNWVSQATNVNILPQPTTALSYTTTASTGWWVTSQGNDDTNGFGRGAVSLSWPGAPGATGYYVYLFDGYQYDQVGSTTTTSWSSSSKGIYPSDSQIAAMTAGRTTSPFITDGTGLDLRDNPNALYLKMSGGANSTSSAYQFIVCPYNSGGTVVTSACSMVPVALDSRTRAPYEDPQHTYVGLGTWDNHGAQLQADTQSLELSTTDLAIASWGPQAELGRTYSSLNSTTGYFAPGWFFNFQQNLQFNLQGSPPTITYTDAQQLQHVFTQSGGVWVAPNGFLGTLAQVGSNWTIAFQDQSTLTFSGSGTLSAQTDKDGNQIAYSWTAGNLTITAANGQTIQVTCTSGHISSATYQTSAGLREVDYISGSSPQVTYYPGTQDLRVVAYNYDANNRLTVLKQMNWPSSGTNATEQFTYSSGQLVDVYYPDYYAPLSKADAYTSIAYVTGQATVTPHGAVGGVANQPINVTTYSWDTTTYGLKTEVVGTGGGSSTWSYSYAFDHQLVGKTCTDGTQAVTPFDQSDNMAGSTSVAGASQSVDQTYLYAYDPSHRLISETSSQGAAPTSTTSYTYTGNDCTETKWVDVNNNVLSDRQDSYATVTVGGHPYYGALVSETTSVAAGAQPAETDYGQFYANGDPGTVTYDNVQLAHGGSSSNLTETSVYDGFGNLMTTTDWSNSRIVETYTYDIAGQLISSTDAAGVTQHSSYDCLGNVTSRWASAPGSSQLNSWRSFTYDPLGRTLTETTKLSDSQGNLTVESVVTNTYDGEGDQLTSTDTTTGGAGERWVYDQFGNVTKQWDMGAADNTTDGRATRDNYDAQNDVVGESLPGNANAPGATGSSISTYDDNGNVTKEINPDGSWTSYSYDGEGNETSVTEPTSGYSSNPNNIAVTTEAYDAADNLVSATPPSNSSAGITTTYDYDLLGRMVSAAVDSSASSSTTEYNNLGWVLETADANGVSDMKTYDTHGCVVSEAVGDQPSVIYTYDNDNNLLTETIHESNGSTEAVVYTRDPFGNATDETHTVGATVVKDISTTVDSLGRPVDVHDNVTGLKGVWTYPVNAATGTQETINYDSTPLTRTVVTHNARDVETQETTSAAGATVTRSISDSPSGRDMADRWIQTTIQKSGVANPVIENRSINGADQLKTQSAAYGGSTLYSGSYAYDVDTGLLTGDSFTFPLGGLVSYSYSYYPDQRLATATANGVAGSYAYDSAGNLSVDTEGATTTNLSYDSANHLTQASNGTTTTYFGWNSADGWRTCQGPNPNPSPANEPITYGYNAAGSMTAFTNTGTSTTATYTYDAIGQRTASTTTIAGVVMTTNWAYDGIGLMGLRATQGSSSWRIDYLYDEEGTPYGAVYRSPSTSASPTYLNLITDDRGDVCELLDAAGNAFAAYHYDAWGVPQGDTNHPAGIWTQSTSLVNATLATQIANRQVLRYAGYVFDSESGLYYCSARYFDPATRQFLTADSAKADGEESAYQYCSGNPVTAKDATGTCWTETHNVYKKKKKSKTTTSTSDNNRGTNGGNQTHGAGWLIAPQNLAMMYDHMPLWQKKSPMYGKSAKKKRAFIAKVCRVAVKRHSIVYPYHDQNARPMPVTKNNAVYWPNLPSKTDCSGFATWVYFVAGAPDPNNCRYDGSGFTGTLCVHGRATDLKHAKPGDLAFYSEGHVIVNFGPNEWASQGGPNAGPYFHSSVYYRSDYWQCRTYPMCYRNDSAGVKTQ